MRKKGNTITKSDRKVAERNHALSECYKAYKALETPADFRPGRWWKANCAAPVPNQTYPHPEHRSTGRLPHKFLVPRTTFIDCFNQMLLSKGALPAKIGRPFTFQPEQELEILANINDAESKLGVLT